MQAILEHVPGETESALLDPVTGDVMMQVITELAAMASMLGRPSARRLIAEIQATAATLLHRIAQLIVAGEINPWTRLRLSPGDASFSPAAEAARIGIFPLPANPLHWGHLLAGLSAMAHANLDKIVYVVSQDSVPSADVYPEEIRRQASAEAIALFQPLFTMVPSSAGRPQSGPASFFRLLGLNGQQMMEAFYITGHECSEPTSPAGIFGALRQTPATHNERLHPVTVMLLDASHGPGPQDSRALAIQAPLPAATSTGIRAALRSPLHRDELAYLPTGVFRHLRVLSAFD